MLRQFQAAEIGGELLLRLLDCTVTVVNVLADTSPDWALYEHRRHVLKIRL